MLQSQSQNSKTEAGCDEAGRGCLAGSVFAAAVILPKDYFHPLLNDSKKLSLKQRNLLRKEIEKEAVDFAVASVSNEEIDKINILQASVKAMHLALAKLSTPFEHIIVDGNYFKPYSTISHQTFVGGDGRFFSIAAASVLAKTYRDEWIEEMHDHYPQYDWVNNKAYATAKHRAAILQYGLSPLHRQSFQLKELQGKLF